MSLIIFPEGRIDEAYPPVLQEFKNGPFRLAIEKNIPIVPVSIINIWQIMWDNGMKFGTRPGIGEIYVHQPISTIDFGEDSQMHLKEEVFKKLTVNYSEDENR
jgi:1-acyl-sn-glycerol-3-phosphate acyltransferase